ncbi:MAG: TetR/AcrR family transcriptional regulator [Muribaculaceae bacterium]|nr:TetR/AcrR family transcriptional regulator [Muribaculaceae bacterium]
MKKEDISPELYQKILECFMTALMKNGLKATTMDSVAANLQMSKRTLYEIFGNKEDLFLEATIFFHKKMRERLSIIFSQSQNVMEAIIQCFLYNRDVMSKLNPEFIRDIEEYANKQHLLPDSHNQRIHQNFYEILQKGVTEGYFRQDVNLKVQCRMLALQMEALKRTEELFPSDISLLEVYDNVIIGFLRAISSEKGLKELDHLLPSVSSLSHNLEN